MRMEEIEIKIGFSNPIPLNSLQISLGEAIQIPISRAEERTPAALILNSSTNSKGTHLERQSDEKERMEKEDKSYGSGTDPFKSIPAHRV